MKLIGYSSDNLEITKYHPINTHCSQSKKDSFNALHISKQKCCYCEIKLTFYEVTREHIKPKSKGGRGRTFRHKNIKPCCEKCNREKNNMNLIEYKVFLYMQAGKQDPNILYTKIKNIERLLR